MRCLICKKNFIHLGSHVAKAHKITAREYKEEFELPYNMALVEPEVSQKQSEAWHKHKAQNLKNIGRLKKYRFKKGHNGHRRISEFERKRIVARILQVNRSNKTPKVCPVCRCKFYHLENHLVMKHGLLKVPK